MFYLSEVKNHYLALKIRNLSAIMTQLSSNCSVFRLSLLVGLICLCSFSSFSQGNSGYNLLWEISGKGLKKPSYIFGSLHLKDRRLFNFSDSVMIALSSCSTFALEVHPDSMIRSVLNSEAEGKEFKSLLKNDYDKPDDMQTFTDAYLYGVAKTLRKQVIGLEQIQTQLDLLDSWSQGFDDSSDDSAQKEQELVEEMIKIYARGNLNEIWVFMMKMGSGLGDISDRNNVMANSIADVISGGESLFATVGAAHMPGEQGVIALLKKAGYSLRPVNATFTGQSAKYKIDHSKMEWFLHTDSANGFQLSFPGKPFEMKVKGVVNPLAYPDLSNGAVYAVISTFTGPVEPKDTKSYIDSLLQSYLRSEGSTLLERKEMLKDGVHALDVVLEKDKQFSRVQLFHKNGVFYFLMIANEANTVKENYADLFLNSFKTIQKSAKIAIWAKYHNEEGSFSTMMPGTPEYVKNEVQNPTFPDHPYEIHMYVAVDKVKQSVYVVRYNDFPTGMYLSDRNLVFESLIREFSSKGELVGAARTIHKNGLEGRELEVLVKGMMMEFKFFIQANRIYVLLRQNLSGPEPVKGDTFFDAFVVEKSKSPESKNSRLADLEVVGPEAFVLIKTDEKDDDGSFLWSTRNYAAKNKYTGGVYSFEEGYVSPYYRNLHLDSLYLETMDQMSGDKDSVLKSEESRIGTVKARQLFSINKASGMMQRRRMWIDKDRFYSQNVVADHQEMESKTVSDFFDKVQSHVRSTFDITASKAALIIKDLSNADTTISKRALAALSYYEFDSSELPVIYGALKRKYTNDTVVRGTRVKLMAQLLSLKDSRTLPVLKEVFNDRSNADLVRAEVLSIVTRLDKANYDWYVKTLLAEKPMAISDSRRIFEPLRDSISLAAANMEGLVKLFNHKPYHQDLLYLFNDLLKKPVRAQYLPLFERRRSEWEAHIVRDMDEALKHTQDLENLNYQLIYSYLEMMPALKLNKLTDEYTKKLFAVDSITYLHTSALSARILSGLDLNPEMLSQKFDSLDTRMEILRAFNEAERLQEVPEKYRKKSEFARLCFYNYLIDDADPPFNLALLGQFLDHEKTYYVFQFEHLNEEGKLNTYIGVCGGFDEHKEQLEFDSYDCYTDYDVKTADWLEQAKALIPE